MTEVLVRDLDKNVVERLRARARGNGRSFQGELKLILEEAARSTRIARPAYQALANHVRAVLGGRPEGDSGPLLAEDRDR